MVFPLIQLVLKHVYLNFTIIAFFYFNLSFVELNLFIFLYFFLENSEYLKYKMILVILLVVALATQGYCAPTEHKISKRLIFG